MHGKSCVSRGTSVACQPIAAKAREIYCTKFIFVEVFCIEIFVYIHTYILTFSYIYDFCIPCRCRFMALLPGAFREFSPALALSLLDPKLAWAEAETQASVQSGVQIQRADGGPLSPYDLKRLQVCFPHWYGCCRSHYGPPLRSGSTPSMPLQAGTSDVALLGAAVRAVGRTALCPHPCHKLISVIPCKYLSLLNI